MGSFPTYKKKIKVLQLNKLYPPDGGGIENVVKQIAEGIADKINSVVVVSSFNKEFLIKTINGVEIYSFNRLFTIGNMPVSLPMIFNIKRYINDSDIVLLHMPFPLGDLALLLSGYKGKVIIWWHSEIVKQKFLKQLYYPIMLRMLKRADLILTATQGHINGSTDLKPFEAKCRIIPFSLTKEAELAAAKGHPVKNSELRLLFVGRLVYYKGCEVLLEALEKVKNFNIELTIVGDGYLLKKLIKLCAKFGIKEKVMFMGKVSNTELYKCYEECDVLVFPSVAKSEAFGLVQIEAMAFGKPVINTQLNSGVPYVSIHNETGLTVKPGSVQELADAILWMRHNEEERLLMGARAKAKVKNEYTEQIMLEKIFKTYDDILSKE